MECGTEFTGLISEDPARNLCTAHRPKQEISRYRSIHFRSFEPHFDRGLNAYVSTRTERRRLIEKQGLIEVGNELDYMKEKDPETVYVSDEAFHAKVKEVEQRLPSYDANDAADSS
jgi:hypothetical protein